jgi:hypothetical protein
MTAENCRAHYIEISPSSQGYDEKEELREIWDFATDDNSTITILAMTDRCTTNYWPRQAFHIGSRSAGNDQIDGFKPGPWSVVLYDIVARVSDRFSICCFNFKLISRHVTGIVNCRILFCASTSSSFINVYYDSWGPYYGIMDRIIVAWKNCVDCSNIVWTNLRAHKWNGIALCILTMIHLWSILLPSLTHR